MFKRLVLSCLLVSCLADPLVLPSWLSDIARRLGQGCADRAEGWRACASLEDPSALAPHSRDCGAFFYCAGQGRPACRRCPAGLHFNPQLQVCDWPSNVDCTSTTPYPTTTDEGSSSTVTESSTKPEEYFTTEVPSSTIPDEEPTSVPTSTIAFDVLSTSEPSTTAFDDLSTSEPSTTAFDVLSTSEPSTTAFDDLSTSEPSTTAFDDLSTSEPSTTV